jgi:hypothetical protein
MIEAKLYFSETLLKNVQLLTSLSYSPRQRVTRYGIQLPKEIGPGALRSVQDIVGIMITSDIQITCYHR